MNGEEVEKEMAKNEVKFKMSIKELTFEYEGNHERASVIQERIADTLGSLAKAQTSVIDVDPSNVRTLPTAPTPEPSRRKKRRGKTAPSGNGASPPIDEADTEAGAEARARSVRPKGQSGRSQILLMIQDNFFSQKRDATSVRAELSRRGHNFEPNYVASDLLQLTKGGYLQREKNSETKKWEYAKGANNDFSGS